MNVKKAMNGWRLKRNGCEFTVVPDEICSLPTTLRADLSCVTFRRDASPFFAALMEENGGSLTDETTKEAILMNTWRPVAGETRRRLKICHKSGQEAQDSESLGVLSDHKSEDREHRESCSSDIEQMQPLEEDDFLPDVNGGIPDLRPTSQQGNRWNLRNRKDQRNILWLIRKKHPKLVIGCGKCILFCTVLYHEQIRRGAWFLHDLSGNASQLSLPCMIRLECRQEVFHALGNSRDRRDGDRVSFLTNSPHIARKAEGTNCRENLDSEICEDRRQQIGDADHASSTMHKASGTQVKPLDLTPQIMRKRSRRSEGGQIVQELIRFERESTGTMPKEDGCIPSWFERRVKRRCST